MDKLLFRGRSVDEWRSLGQTTHRARLQRLLCQADSYADWLPPDEHPRESITYIGMAAANLSLAYLLTDSPGHLETLRRWIRVAIAYPHWGRERMPDHDLDAAWLLCGLGLAYDWVGEHLRPAEREALRKKLLLQGSRLYDFALQHEGNWWSSAYWQNHNWICYAGLAVVAYALQRQHPETTPWAERALNNFRTVLTLMPDDGSDYEGPVYWCYGVPWLLLGCDLFQQHAGVDLHSSPFLRNTFAYRLYVSGPNLVDTANFGDCHDRRSAHSAAIYYRLASLYDDGYAQWLALYFEATGEWAREGREGLLKPGLRSQAWLEFLWYDPSVQPRRINDLPLVRTFPDLGLVSARSSWDADATFLAFKCGKPSGHKARMIGHALNRRNGWQTLKASHAHPDENSFVLMRGDDYLVVDEGYSQAKRTQHHSTVLVDGQGQYREGAYNAFVETGAGWGGRLEAIFTTPDLVYARGEAAAAYDPALGLRRFTRQILLLGDRLVLICDDLVASEPRAFSWLLQTDAEPRQLSQAVSLVEAGESQLRVVVLQPDRPTVASRVEEVVANPSSASPDWILRHRQHVLELRPSQPVSTCRFLVLLSIEKRGDAGLRAEALDCLGGQASAIELADSTALVAFAAGRSGLQIPGTLETDGGWAVVLQHPDGAPISLAAGDATQLWLGNRLCFAADTPLDVALHAETWRLRGTAPTTATLWTPWPSATVLLDGAPAAVTYDATLSCLRLAIPAGDVTLQLR